MLDAFIRLGKGIFELIFNDTYSCMIHELVMSNNLQMLYQELSLIHALMLKGILLRLTWIS